MALTKRVQVLMEPSEYEWVRRVAAREGVSVGELARSSLREVHGPPVTDEAQAALAWWAEPDIELSLPDDPAALDDEIEEAFCADNDRLLR